MQIDKQTIIDLLRQRGQEDQAQQADAELPDQVDHERDAGLLEKFGINPQDLLGKITGGGIPGLS
jgi:hypothetical protein